MPCHPESRAAIGFLANTFQVNRTVLTSHRSSPPACPSAVCRRHAWREGSSARHSPFVIGQVARISQVIAVVLRPVLVRPHWRPPSNQESRRRPSNQSDSKESRSLRTDTKSSLL